MADKHPSGNRRLVEQHKTIQRQGDAELKGTAGAHPESNSDPETELEYSGSRSTGGSFAGP